MIDHHQQHITIRKLENLQLRKSPIKRSTRSTGHSKNNPLIPPCPSRLHRFSSSGSGSGSIRTSNLGMAVIQQWPAFILGGLIFLTVAGLPTLRLTAGLG